MEEQDSKLLAEVRSSVSRIQIFEVASLSRREELGRDLSFEEAVRPAQRIIRLFQQISLEHINELPDQLLSNLKNNANSVYNIIENMLSFSARQDNALAVRNSYIQSLNSQYDNLFSQLYQTISYLSSRERDFAALEQQARAATQAARDDAVNLKSELSRTQEEAQKILADVRKVAAEQGVSQQAIYFKDEAEFHDAAAIKWQQYTSAIAAIFILCAIGSIFIHKISFLAPQNPYDTMQLAISKMLIFAVLGYILILCSRNFLSHKHNSIVNKHRQNALLTFNALVNASNEHTNKDIVLTHASICIFSPQETGYTKSNNEGSNIKLIEVAPKIGSATSS